ncbi:acyltransferase [Pseudoalteromonas fuliginea]|uniref:Acyltransferase n=1 Tax=Pseudoalteromonas fuliginea TaxID=1872678 RepID=A0AB73BHQ3_9GAMM|nr:acyltransferase family protein [Pseudoalteromonas fuliginea]KAA1161003.1 acyltransferase [Pseudoalteromonas fuliginea]
MKFREDINGLRAIAVIAVVLFHFRPAWMPGGFAGVDVFFVISGFLMTGIIFRGIEKESFSILKFYVARANRIIPALSLLCLALLVFGWLYLIPMDYKTLGKHAGSSISFLSNIIYWRESGYFDSSSQEKWLLHTWSLSIEWQFYIIYPLILVAMKRFMSISAMKKAILIGTIIGFIFSIIITYNWPNAAYFLLPTRAWEMMIGGVAYLYPFNLRGKQKKITEWVGIILIFSSYIFISKSSPWPGYLAIFPVLGSFMIIQAKSNGFITHNKVFQKLGAWSYSIYLWHWPLVVTIFYFSLNDLFIYLGITLSIFLGFLSHTYIEKIRFKNEFSHVLNYLKCKPLLITLVIFSSSAIIFSTSGVYHRYSDDIQLKNTNALNAISDWDYPQPNLRVGSSKIRFLKGSSDKNILFIGASHIEQTYPYVQSLNSTYNIYYLTKEGCFVTPSYVHPKWSCNNIQNYKDIVKNIHFEKIVTSFYLFDEMLSEHKETKEEQLKNRINEYDKFLLFVKENSKKTYLILGEPKGIEFDPKMSARFNLPNYINVQTVRKQYNLHNEAIKKLENITDIRIIDPIDFLCTDICKVMDSKYTFYYKDSTHFRPWYAKKSLQYLNTIFE